MDLLRMLTGPVYAQSAALPHKQAYCSIAKCVAALTRACPAEGPAVVGQFIQVNPHSQNMDRQQATITSAHWPPVKAGEPHTAQWFTGSVHFEVKAGNYLS